MRILVKSRSERHASRSLAAKAAWLLHASLSIFFGSVASFFVLLLADGAGWNRADHGLDAILYQLLFAGAWLAPITSACLALAGFLTGLHLCRIEQQREEEAGGRMVLNAVALLFLHGFWYLCIINLVQVRH